MAFVDRWQYPWIVLTLLLIGIATFGLYSTGISTTTIFAALVAIGVFLIVIHPRMYGYVVTSIGLLSIALASILLDGEYSLVTVGALILVGVGAVARGVHAHLNMEPEQ